MPGPIFRHTMIFNDPQSTSGGGGAPANASYVTVGLDATLTDERVLAVGAGLSLADGGPGANITISPALDLAALVALAGTGIAVHTAADTWAVRSLVAPAAGISIANADGVAGNPTFSLINDLGALEGLAGTGLAVRTAADTWAQRTLVAPAAGLTIGNADGVAGNPTFALANDLAALEGIGTTGLAVRTGAEAWTTRSIAISGGLLTVVNGDGIAGNPTIGLLNSAVDHGGLGGLGDDDHAQYALLAGRAGGQTLNGGSAASENLILRSTANATKGTVQLDDQVLLWPSHPDFVAGTSSTRNLMQFTDSYTSNPNGAIHVLRGLSLTPAITSAPVGLFDNNQFVGIYFAPTASMTINNSFIGMYGGGTYTNTTAAAFGFFNLFFAEPTLTSATANIAPYNPIIFYSNPTASYTAAAGTATSSYLSNFLESMEIVNSGAGTHNVTDHVAFESRPYATESAGTLAITKSTRFWARQWNFTGTPTLTTDAVIYIEDLIRTGITTGLSIESLGTAVELRHAGPGKFGATGAPDTTNGNVFEVERTHTLAANVGDGQAAGVVLDPGYSGAFTVTRHNYIKYEQASLSGSTITDACVGWFDAAVGTHWAVGAGSTKASPGTVDAWLKYNINGTIHYVPAYTSKTT